jgi:hypothetical protein
LAVRGDRWPPPGRGLATLLILVAIGIAGLALAINSQTGHTLGTTPLAAMPYGQHDDIPPDRAQCSVTEI